MCIQIKNQLDTTVIHYQILVIISKVSSEYWRFSCRCKIPGLHNDTFQAQNDWHRQMINQSIPVPEDPTSIHQYDRCHVIQYESNTSSLIKCTEWVYDTSVFDETFASKVRGQNVCLYKTI